MVSSMTKKTISLAISLLVAVISLTGVALGAGAPSSVTALSPYTPGFVGTPGKMALDAAGNLYVTDFWGKGIVKLNRDGSRAGFIATNGRPSAVAVLPDNRLVVAMAAPQPYVAFYDQLGSSPTVTGEEAGVFGTPAEPYYRPTGITVDAAGYIYVLDSGDSSGSKNVLGVVTDPGTSYWGKVRVYSSVGAYLHVFGARTHANFTSTVGGEFKQPASIVYEKSSNKIVVVDTMNGRLQFFAAYNGTACVYDKSVGGTAGLTMPTVNSNPVTFGNPVDVAFEYDASSVLQRMYVVERGLNQISVLNPTTSLSTMLMGGGGLAIVGSTIPAAGVVFNAPTAAVFAKTATGGVLYVGNAANATAANVLPLAVDSGSLSSGPALTMAALPETVQTATINLSGTVTSGNTVICKVNDVTVTTTGTSNWSANNVALATGYNSIVCSSTNVGGTSYVQATTYYVPALLTAPTVTIAQPGAGVYTKNATVTVSGTSDTANATVQVVNGLNSYTVTTTTGAAKTWSATVNLATGSNPITVSAWKVGTATGTANVTLNADYTLPGVVVASLDNATTNSAVQNIDGIVTEANLDSIEVNGVAVAAAAKVSLGSNNTYFSAPVILQRGSNTITVAAKDLAGNVTTVTRAITLAPELPLFTVDLPADNSFLSGVASAVASGAAETPYYSSVDAAGSIVAPAGGAWNTTGFAVSGGIKAYLFTATDGTKTVSAKRTILNDAGYAQLAITSPAADQAVKVSPVVIKVVNGTAVEPTVSVSGGATASAPTYSAVDGTFSYTVTLPSQGSYSFKATTGTSTAVRNIIYDTTLPELTLQADSKPMPTTITGVIESTAKVASITATLNGTSFALPASKITFEPVSAGAVVWHADLASYPYDLNSLVVTTADPAGNEKQLPYTNMIPTGDVDGDGVVRLSDALAALRHVAGTQLLIGDHFTQADVGELVKGRAGRDGIVDITDSVLILSKSYGLMTF